MDAQYFVRKVEQCPECNGEGVYYNPEWAELNEEHAHRCRNAAIDDRFAEFDKMVREKWPYGEPPEELQCCECEGTGKIETWVSLKDALRELGVSLYPPDWEEQLDGWARLVTR